MGVTISSVLGDIMQNAPQEALEFSKLPRAEQIRIICEEENSIINQEEYDRIPCDKCKGKGYYYTEGETMWIREECSCVASRMALNYVESLGLLKDVKKCNFDSYVPYDEPTKQMKKVAMNYQDGWLYLAGQSGSGKTHLAYSIFGKMVKRHKAPKWFRWIQDSQEIKRVASDEVEYDRLTKPLMTCSMLFIDDFFNVRPTDADIRLARVILDYRYTNNLPTVITSELMLSELNELDDAIAGRIAEMGTVFQIRGTGHNYRMRKYNEQVS